MPAILTLPLFVFLRGLCALSFLHRLAQKILHLTVDTAQFVRRPSFQLAPQLGINSQQKGFALLGRHVDQSRIPRSHASRKIASSP
jgi:hypothetical protein